MGKPIIWSGVNAKLINSGDLLDKNNNSLTNGSKITVVQSAHGFTSADVGRPLYLNGGTWTLAIATSVAASTIAGFIYSVLNVNTLLISFDGLIPNVGANFLEGGGSLTAGTIYYLSPTTAGSVTSTAPSTAGQISLVVGEALTSTNFIAGVQSGRVLYESQIIDVSTSTNALRVTQRGSGPALLIEDEANPDSTPFVITNNGRVGVGTLTPTYAFDLNGTGFRLNNLTGGQSTLFIETTAAGVNNWSIRSGTAGFLFRDTTNALDRLVIDNNGNIGCGISVPQQRLDVNGTAKVTEVTDRNNFSLTNGDKIDVAQASHGFTTADIGRPLYLNGTTWTLAQADTAAKAEVAGFIYGIVNANNLKIATSGEIPAVGANLLEGGGSLVAGESYFLSATSAGKITATEPTTVGYVSKPIGIAKSTTAFQFFNMRGSVVGSTNARTQITLSNNTTGTVQNMAAYDAGEIVGWVYIDATTDYRFLAKIQFAKNGAGSNYNLSYQTVGDTPPSGFSFTVTSGGVIQYTMPNVSGFSSAIFNYALNAPAVGTNFPLSIDASAISTGTITAARLPQVSSSNQGAFPSSVSSLDDATATKLGLKQYFHGVAYNGGVAPTLTCPQGGFAVARAVFVPYQMQDGTWRMRWNIRATFTSASVTSVTMTINGLTFAEAWACSGLWGGVSQGVRAFVNASAATMGIDSPAYTTGALAHSGDVELQSKPTWAY